MPPYTTAMKEGMGLDPEEWDIVADVFKSPTGNPTGTRGLVVVRVTHVPTKRALEERIQRSFTKRQASEALGRLLQSLLQRLGRPPAESKRRRR